jgi:quercetin dioxygenase-like cupin family protein
MMSNMMRAALLGCALAFAAPAPAQEDSTLSQGLKVEPILRSSKTADGEPVRYPGGDKAQIVSVIVSIEPGGRTTLHRHPVPVFAYVLEGTLVVKEEGREPRTYHRGDAFLETVGHWHQGFNGGGEITRVLAVFLGEEGGPITEDK